VCKFVKVCRRKNAHGIITGETPDISEYLDFEFYDWVLFRGKAGPGEVELGRWLGVSHRVGHLMSYWILSEIGIPISATTVQRMTNDEQCTKLMKLQMTQYNDKLSVLFDAQSAEINVGLQAVDGSKMIDPDNEDLEFFNEFTRVIDDATLPHADNRRRGSGVRRIFWYGICHVT
jgi:hypothetical protein